jgi:sulfite reductase beta subunit-like hemoprotein
MMGGAICPRVAGHVMTKPLPAAVHAELESFAGHVRAFLDGKLAPDIFRGIRTLMGIYGMRGHRDRVVVRVKIPGGRLTAEHLDFLAAAADQSAGGRLHFTTRQNAQLYGVPLSETPALLRRIESAGLTCRESAGNSVRTIAACPRAGACPNERFDIAPYAQAASSHFLRNPRTQQLPRKFKVAFSGCEEDCGRTLVQDLGVRAVIRGNGHGKTGGFMIFVGGGLGRAPRPGRLLEPFTEAAHLVPTMEAILAVFNERGDRQDRHRARLKHLVDAMGMDAFQSAVFERRAQLLAERRPFPPSPAPALPAPVFHTSLPDHAADPAYQAWLATNVLPHRTFGLRSVAIRLPVGDATADQARIMAGLARAASSPILSTTSQNLVIRDVPESELAAVHAALVAAGLGEPGADTVRDIVRCAGVRTCRIGITNSRGLAQALAPIVSAQTFRDPQVDALRIHISGCPNGCGGHALADIGFYGAARPCHGRTMPHYEMVVAGATDGETVRFAETVLRIPAKRVPAALHRLVRTYVAERHAAESFAQFVQRVGIPYLKVMLDTCSYAPAPDEDPDAYRDWGSDAEFTVGRSMPDNTDAP